MPTLTQPHAPLVYTMLRIVCLLAMLCAAGSVGLAAWTSATFDFREFAQLALASGLWLNTFEMSADAEPPRRRLLRRILAGILLLVAFGYSLWRIQQMSY